MNASIDIPKDVRFILNKLESGNFEAYIVGGCVRDSILSRKPKDWDICTNARPEVIVNLFKKVVLTGLSHGTVTVILNSSQYEVTTYRSDGEYEDSRHPKKVTFVNELREDLLRRDFTINAMAYNEKAGLVDYFNGVEDLKNKTIKTVGVASQRFNEDALRLLRAIRFSAELNFNIEVNTLIAIKDLKDNITKISKERIREEFNKIIISNPKKLNLLRACGLLENIIPFIKNTYNFNQNNPYHIYNLYDHIIKSTELIEAKLHLRLTMLLHDLGKINTKTTDERGISHYYNHGKESQEIGEKILKELKYDNLITKNISKLVYYHDYTLESKKSIKKILNNIGEDLTRDLIKVKKADILAQNPDYKINRLEKLIKLENLINEIIYEKECFSLKDLKINGNDLVKLGFNKGKDIGDTLNYLLDLVMADPKINEKDILIKKAIDRLNSLKGIF